MALKIIGRLVFFFVVVLFVADAMAVEKPTTLDGSCVTAECHVKYSPKEHVHGPVELGDCKSCHETSNVKEHTFKLAHEGRDLCESCHLGHASETNVHEPVAKGKCMDCHDPHGNGNKYLLVKENIADVCADCHQVAQHDDYLHGPVAVGQCTICHDSHSSDHKGLLTLAPSKLCVSCHVITKDELEKFEYIHEPAKGDCVGCHNPHGADNANMLKDKTPEMCYSCHEDIKKTAENSNVKHSIVTEEGGCLKCHTPHASTVKFILKSDPATLCVSCHNKPLGVTKDHVLPAFTDQIEDKKFLHGPVAEKDCNGCHTAHGSEHFRLLSKQYPPLFYAPYNEDNYQLCFSCHPKDIALTESTSKLTDFRNGRSNLHFLHVNKDRRGRTCRACHQTHASNLPKHIRETVPYGAWELPIQFAKTETGGTCTPGCHKTKDYDRENAVDYSTPETVKVQPKEPAADQPAEEEAGSAEENKDSQGVKDAAKSTE